jgi:succinyl-diaminopimelate desuccinylase
MGGAGDPLALAQALLRCRSVTPADGGAQAVLAAALAADGFRVTRLEFGGIENLYAARDGTGAELCFAGHTDVVPPGDAAWAHDPFAGEARDGVLYGRGACDMKGAIAAFVAAAAAAPGARLSLLITGDEEGEAVNGTVKVLAWMAEQGRNPEFCVVGEPTSKLRLGDQIKIGRRGSLNARITVHGRQGHVAYPLLADNPVHRLVAALNALAAHRLDEGTAWFEPSSLQITSVDVGNQAGNVIPAMATARLNVRFNDLHSEASLTGWLGDTLAIHAPDAQVEIKCSGAAFLTRPGPGTEHLAAAITGVTGIAPAQNTGGGTSDARFISKYFPVAEFGLVGATMHQADEAVPIADLQGLTRIYRNLIERFCG